MYTPMKLTKAQKKRVQKQLNNMTKTMIKNRNKQLKQSSTLAIPERLRLIADVLEELEIVENMIDE